MPVLDAVRAADPTPYARTGHSGRSRESVSPVSLGSTVGHAHELRVRGCGRSFDLLPGEGWSG